MSQQATVFNVYVDYERQVSALKAAELKKKIHTFTRNIFTDETLLLEQISFLNKTFSIKTRS